MIYIVETLGSGLYGTSFSIHPHYSTMTLKGTHALFIFQSQNHPLYDPRFMNAPLSLHFLSFIPHFLAAYPREMRKMVVASGQGERPAGGHFSGYKPHSWVAIICDCDWQKVWESIPTIRAIHVSTINQLLTEPRHTGHQCPWPDLKCQFTIQISKITTETCQVIFKFYRVLHNVMQQSTQCN